LIINELVPLLEEVEVDNTYSTRLKRWSSIPMLSEPCMPFLHQEQQWYCVEVQTDLKNVDSLAALPFVEFIDEIRSGKVILGLFNLNESFTWIVDLGYRIATELNIPPNHIALFSNAGRLDISPDTFRYFWIRDFESIISNQVKAHPDDTTLCRKDHNGVFEKKYLMLNRRWRLHRPYFVALLNETNLLDQGLVSLAPADCGFDWDQIIQLTDGIALDMYTNHEWPEFKPRILQALTNAKLLPPMYLDTDDLTINQADYQPHTNKLYEQTYFSVVSETNYFGPGDSRAPFLSEKTFKTIAHRHPFVMLAPSETMACLKDIGYKTFDGFIDETYDKEKNDVTRMKMVLEETRRLCSLSPDEVKQFVQGTSAICEHNLALMRNRPVNDFYKEMNL